MRKTSRFPVTVATLMLCVNSWAGFNLPTLDTTQIDPIFRTLATSFFFRPVEPASGYGRLWGIGVGVAATAASSSAVSSIFTGMSSAYVPTGEIQFGVTLPGGFTFEAGFLPTLTYDGSTMSKVAGGLKWNLTRSFLSKAPLDIAIQGTLTKGSLAYIQDAGGSVNVDYSSSVVTGALIVSKNFVVLEPFAGIGFANHASSLSATGVGSLFGGSFPAATTSTTGTSASLWLHAGVLLNLQVLRLSGSYDYAFGLTSWSFKAGFSI